MSIEDIDYLKKNSIRQRYLFLVNSSDRDRSINPTPSQYVVNFTMPFKNVVGLEVVDSSIPRTMYNIDVYNNSIVFLIYDPVKFTASTASNNTSMFVTVNVEPGDYTIETLLIAINNVLSMEVNGNTIPITAVSLSNPPEIKNTIKFHCPYPFILDMSKSTISQSIGFDLYTNPASESIKPIYNQYYIALNYPNNYKLYGSVNISPGNPNVTYYTYNVFTGPTGVVRKQSIALPNRLAQSFQVTTHGYLTNIQAALSNTTGIIANTNIAIWELWTNDPINNKPANFTGTTNVIETTYIDGGYSQSSHIATNVFLKEGTYWLVFKSNDPTLQLYYNDVTNVANTTFILSQDNGSTGSTWYNLDDTVNQIYFQASIIVTMQEDYNIVIAPGIYNLIGERYIILRCPEIEQNKYRYLAYTKHFMGLAKFNLDTIGYNNTIIDYNDTNKKDFHPIGKLTKLSLSFETSTGNIYDFKGVNHSLTFAIYYYEPSRKQEFVNSILNPNYKPNFAEYMRDQEAQEEESDDQEFDYDEDNINNYKIRGYYATQLAKHKLKIRVSKK